MAHLTDPVDAESGSPFVEAEGGLSHPSPRHARAFLGLLRSAEQLDRVLDGELRAEHGLTLRQFEVLLHLAVFAPRGHLRIGELVAQAPLSQSRVSRLVAELESRGLVRRTPAEDDSRAVQVSITDAGRQRLREAQPTHHQGLDRWLFSRLTGREVIELGRITGKLLGGVADGDVP
ncbi:MAG TPA: MarR family transcriptional regulator [Acidimicrobiales bacterium]|nr:MarR family transcriptional regulator [Acidimicrobiales bacterium]